MQPGPISSERERHSQVNLSILTLDLTFEHEQTQIKPLITRIMSTTVFTLWREAEIIVPGQKITQRENM